MFWNDGGWLSWAGGIHSKCFGHQSWTRAWTRNGQENHDEGSTNYSVEISDPAKAKSHNCFVQVRGEVKPGSRPQPVRYSTQFGPPSAVAVYENRYYISIEQFGKI